MSSHAPAAPPQPAVAGVWPHQSILDRHRALDVESRRANGRIFVSGWHTSHPFAARYLSDDAVPDPVRDATGYVFLSDDRRLREKIAAFHAARGEGPYDEEEVFVSAGASPLILAKFLFLRALGVRRAYFVPPIYYTFFYFAKMLDIELVPASDLSLQRPHHHLSLPERPSFLFLADPIWIMGVGVDASHLQTIAEWQRRTGSVVFVDGTFQYFSWRDPHAPEQSALLDRERTMRLVCPTKSVAIHGVRFAYLLLPVEWREEIRYACSNTTGATAEVDLHRAHRIIDALTAPDGNSLLVDFVRRRYRRLLDAGVVRNPAADPCATYYAFVEVPEADRRRYLAMDQEFFGLTEFPRHIRFNLLGPKVPA